jgi:hypothetical protein
MSRTSTPEPTYILKGTRLGETEKAVKFVIDEINGLPWDCEAQDLPRAQWFPLSQVVNMSTSPHGDGEDTITVKAWIMQQKEII